MLLANGAPAAAPSSGPGAVKLALGGVPLVTAETVLLDVHELQPTGDLSSGPSAALTRSATDGVQRTKSGAALALGAQARVAACRSSRPRHASPPRIVAAS